MLSEATVAKANKVDKSAVSVAAWDSANEIMDELEQVLTKY